MEMKADEIPKAIDWHEGLLLTPQHFQQIARRQEALLQYHTAMIAPFYWGIRQLNIEEANLSRGLLQIRHLEAVMPDGLVVSYREGDDLQADRGLQKDLTKSEDLKQERMKIYLVVAPQTNRMLQGKNARYDFYDGEPVADEQTGEGQVRIRRLIPRLRLMIDTKPPQETVNIPLMEVEYKDDRYVQTDFIPPLLIVTSRHGQPAQVRLGLDCEGIAKLARDKVQTLAGRAQSQSPSGAARLDLETTTSIRSLAASLPHLEAILSTEVSHPFPIYLALWPRSGQTSFQTSRPTTIMICARRLSRSSSSSDRQLSRGLPLLTPLTCSLITTKFTTSILTPPGCAGGSSSRSEGSPASRPRS